VCHRKKNCIRVSRRALIALLSSQLDLSDCVIGFRDDIEDIFSYILHIPISADEPAHLACEDGINIAPERLLLLKDNYFGNRVNTQNLLDHLRRLSPKTILPLCGETEHFCRNPSALLVHARLHIFGKKKSMTRVCCGGWRM